MRLSPFAMLPLVPAALGCAGTVAGPADGVDAEATSTSAVVAVERTADPTEGSRAQVSARFLRITVPGSPADALRAIGATLDLPPSGACASVGSLGTAPVAQVPVVELVDVGDVSLSARGDGAETRLAARQLPDVTDVVSGVVYARATDPAWLPASTPYVLHVGGGHGQPGFDVTATAPGDPGDIHVAGEDAQGTIAIAAGPTLELTWSADVADDAVYVEVRPADVRCTFDATGHASVPTALFDDAGTLVVHRLRREALHTPGIASGEVRFDFARALAYVRR
jgi:hypothetical protein